MGRTAAAAAYYFRFRETVAGGRPPFDSSRSGRGQSRFSLPGDATVDVTLFLLTGNTAVGDRPTTADICDCHLYLAFVEYFRSIIFTQPVNFNLYLILL